MANNKKDFKGIHQIKGFNEDGTAKDLSSLENGILYFVRTNKDSNDEGYIYFNGKKYGKIPDGGSSINAGEY